MFTYLSYSTVIKMQSISSLLLTLLLGFWLDHQQIFVLERWPSFCRWGKLLFECWSGHDEFYRLVFWFLGEEDWVLILAWLEAGRGIFTSYWRFQWLNSFLGFRLSILWRFHFSLLLVSVFVLHDCLLNSLLDDLLQISSEGLVVLDHDQLRWRCHNFGCQDTGVLVGRW